MVSPEQVLTAPSTGNSRALKRTYAVAGQQQCPKHQEKTDRNLLDLTDCSTAIPRATKWTKFSKLDRMKKPGLSEKLFHGLFVNARIARGSQRGRSLDITSKIATGTNMMETPILRNQSRKFSTPNATIKKMKQRNWADEVCCVTDT